jgi:uncharacterized phiE125 gp8 family phage protein
MYLLQTAAPSGWPLSLDEAKRQLRVLHSAEDTLIQSLIERATEFMQGHKGRNGVLARALLTQSYEYRIDAFPLDLFARICLPLPPLQTVESVKYIANDGVETTVDPATYVVDIGHQIGRVQLAYGHYWPVARLEPGAVRIRYTCGYGAASDVPATVKQAMLMLITQWFENRDGGGDIPGATDALISNTRIVSF